MMISQLATIAIRARLRVSPATAPPKFASRSNSRSGSLLQRGRQRLRAAASASSGSRFVRSTSVLGGVVGRGGGRRAGLTTSKRVVGLAISAAFEHVDEGGRDRGTAACSAG